MSAPTQNLSQYEDLCQRIIDEGEWVHNERTGKRCLTLINADLEYNVEANEFPLVTTRKSYFKAAIAELLGYLRGYDNAADFRAIGCNTWNANANENAAWLNNPHRKGEDDMGRVYGVQGRRWQKPDGSTLDQLRKIVDDLKNGVDDRGEILTFYNPGEFEMGCLRPCMHTHHFSVLGGKLYLNSFQRSADIPLGINFNQVQVFTLLALMAQITGHKPGKAYHKIVNAHIYEDQLELMRDVQLKREPFPAPKLHINPDIKSLEDVETWVTRDDFSIEGYECHPPIAYPFAV
jgi:thymidylate synthase